MRRFGFIGSTGTALAHPGAICPSAPDNTQTAYRALRSREIRGLACVMVPFKQDYFILVIKRFYPLLQNCFSVSNAKTFAIPSLTQKINDRRQWDESLYLHVGDVLIERHNVFTLVPGKESAQLREVALDVFVFHHAHLQVLAEVLPWHIQPMSTYE